MKKLFRSVSALVLIGLSSPSLLASEGCNEECGSKYELCEEIQHHFSDVFLIENGEVKTFSLTEVENEEDCSVELEFVMPETGEEVEFYIEHYNEIRSSGHGHWFIDDVKVGDFSIGFNLDQYSANGLKNTYEDSEKFNAWGLVEAAEK